MTAAARTCKATPCAKRGGVLTAQHLPLHHEHLLLQCLGLRVLVLVAANKGEVITCAERVRMLVAQHPLPHRQHFPLQYLGLHVLALVATRIVASGAAG